MLYSLIYSNKENVWMTSYLHSLAHLTQKNREGNLKGNYVGIKQLQGIVKCILGRSNRSVWNSLGSCGNSPHVDFLKEHTSPWLGFFDILENCKVFLSPMKTLLAVSSSSSSWLLIVIPFPTPTGREPEQIPTAVNGIILNPSEATILFD